MWMHEASFRAMDALAFSGSLITVQQMATDDPVPEPMC